MRKPRVRRSKTEFTPEERAVWNAYKREYYRKNSQTIITQNNKWRQQHRDLVSDRQQDYRQRQLAADPDWERRAAYRKRYGLTLDQYDAMLDAQAHACAICFGGPRGRNRFHVDHDHQTGAVRALLCWRCNAVLGNVEENAELLSRMIGYLHAHAPAGKAFNGRAKPGANRR